MLEFMLRQAVRFQSGFGGGTQERRRGQGTIEYIGMVVMVCLLAGAVALLGKSWAPDVGAAMKRALTTAIKKVSGGLT